MVVIAWWSEEDSPRPAESVWGSANHEVQAQASVLAVDILFSLSFKQDPISQPEQIVPTEDADSAEGQGLHRADPTSHSEGNNIGGRVMTRLYVVPEIQRSQMDPL